MGFSLEVAGLGLLEGVSRYYFMKYMHENYVHVCSLMIHAFKGDLPGVNKYDLKSRVKMWEEMVVKTREIATLQNNTAPYQDLLRKYLNTCKVAVDNAYVQFLDPDTKDVNVAIQNLEDYVIVGLQNDMGESLSRWVNITKRSCKHHKHFKRLQKVYTDIFDGMTAEGEVKKFRESKITITDKAEAKGRRLSAVRNIINTDKIDAKDANSGNAESTTPGTSLVSPDFNSLDEDLKAMITKFTAGDQKVWERVIQLYEIQKEWGRS
jgi:hypothetical protein